MARKRPIQMGTYVQREPRRLDIWLIVDRNPKHDGKVPSRQFCDTVQGGTRTGIIVSNNKGNTHSPNVEVVFTTTAEKIDLPTHFIVNSTPERSTVLCEEIDTVPKKNLIKYYGTLTKEEAEQLNSCLKVSIGLV